MKTSPFIFLALIAFLGIPTNSLNTESLVRVQSPDGKIRIELVLERHQQADAVPHLRVYFRDQPIILDSRLGINLPDGQELGGSCVIDSVTTNSRHDEYTVFPGKRSHVLDHYTEAVIALREQTPPGRRWELALRAYDDGVAFRYRIPAQDGWSALVIKDEKTEFVFPSAAQAYVLPLNSFTTSYEKYYQKKLVAEIPGDWLIGLPLLLKIPGSGWAAVTEAALTDYAGMYLARRLTSDATSNGTSDACLISRLSPLPKKPGVAVKASLPHNSPWRVIMIAGDVGRLIESDLVLNLNEPVAIPDTSWIRTGKTTFPWWNGYHLENVSFKPGLNTATMMHYIDFCARNGIPYHSLDGFDNVAWYGGPITPYKGADITRALPEIDLPAVIAYAHKKGVRLRLWMHWEAAKAYMDRAFPLYHSWGIEGVMIDFMDRDDQEMINFRHRLLQKAAENQLTVTFHGVSKPTGLERTYPNLLTSEGVLNLEYNKWDKTGCTPEHQLNVAFTRMLAGPLDFHQGSFRGISVEKYKPRNIAPYVMGTPSRTLASYVVYQNHLSMVADYPEAYQGHPGLKILAKIPTSWDDTRFLSGSVGEYIVIARRRG
ncbi:MAG: glycoside hydrolase family 97 catalytic domain-containing protein, partial [Blastocatellia bacterium]|nr:glycoside hydrolase family 97 catalytic domain-containing protein [Blastocatellia bacterium]